MPTDITFVSPIEQSEIGVELPTPVMMREMPMPMKESEEEVEVEDCMDKLGRLLEIELISERDEEEKDDGRSKFKCLLDSPLVTKGGGIDLDFSTPLRLKSPKAQELEESSYLEFIEEEGAPTGNLVQNSAFKDVEEEKHIGKASEEDNLEAYDTKNLVLIKRKSSIVEKALKNGNERRSQIRLKLT